MRKIFIQMLNDLMDATRPTYLEFGFRTNDDYSLFLERAEAVSTWVINKDQERPHDKATLSTIQQYYDRYLYNPHNAQCKEVDHVLATIQYAINSKVSELGLSARRAFAEEVISKALKSN